MPPYGIDSLLNRDFDTQGYFTSPVEEIYDPAFGTLNFRRAYGPAPFTGNIPLTSYRVEPAYKYVSDVDGKINSLGFEGDIDLPSFGGASNPRYDQFGKDIDFINAPQDIYPAAVPPDFINAPQNYYSTDGITNLYGNADDVFPFAPKNRLGGLDLNRFEGIGSLGVANEEDVEQVDYLGSKRNKFQEGIAKLFEFFQRFSPVAAIGRGIDSLRNKIDTRKAIERNIRSDPQGKITTYNLRSPSQIAQDKIDDRGRGQMPSRTTSAPKKSSSAYSEAKRSFFRD